MLAGVCDLGTENDYDPAHLQPGEKKRDGGETAVDGTLCGNADLEPDIDPLTTWMSEPVTMAAKTEDLTDTLVLGITR